MIKVSEGLKEALLAGESLADLFKDARLQIAGDDISKPLAMSKMKFVNAMGGIVSAKQVDISFLKAGNVKSCRVDNPYRTDIWITGSAGCNCGDDMSFTKSEWLVGEHSKIEAFDFEIKKPRIEPLQKKTIIDTIKGLLDDLA